MMKKNVALLAEPSIENDNPAVTSISSVQFGDGNSEILAELKESQVAISESSSSTIKVQDVEDVNEIPIDKLTKEQFARYMDEIKAILTFHPSDFRLHEDNFLILCMLGQFFSWDN